MHYSVPPRENDMSDLERTNLTASEVDRLVGDRIRRRRILMGLPQDQ